MNTALWLGAWRRWLRAQRDSAEMARMTPFEKRDARISDYDLRWR